MKVLQETEVQFARERLDAGCETMEQMLKGLLDSKGRVAEEVHAIRKLGKSLRGGFSLFRLEKSAAGEIQAIGRLLSEPRDAVSRFKTWNLLAWNGDATQAVAITKLLEQQTHSAARRPPLETMLWCVQRVQIARSKLQDLSPINLADTVGKGLKKLEKQALKRCRKLDSHADEGFHEARKAVKAWLGAAGFLPDGWIPANPRLHQLADLLGDENDLATLSTWLDSHGFTARLAPDLWQRVKSKRHAVQTAVIRQKSLDFT